MQQGTVEGLQAGCGFIRTANASIFFPFESFCGNKADIHDGMEVRFEIQTYRAKDKTFKTRAIWVQPLPQPVPEPDEVLDF